MCGALCTWSRRHTSTALSTWDVSRAGGNVPCLGPAAFVPPTGLAARPPDPPSLPPSGGTVCSACSHTCKGDTAPSAVPGWKVLAEGGQTSSVTKSHSASQRPMSWPVQMSVK